MEKPAPRLRLLRWSLLVSCFLLMSACYAFNPFLLFGSQGHGGTGPLAHLEFQLKDGSFIPTSLVWSPDGRYIATSGTHTRLIHIWDVKERKLVKELELPHPPAAQFHNMAWSIDGQFLATCNTFESSLRIFSTTDWHVARDFDQDAIAGCRKPMFSSDGAELSIWGHALTTLATSDWHVVRSLKGTTVLREGDFLKPQADGWDWGMRIRDVAYVPGTHTLVFGGGQYEKIPTPCPESAEPYAGRVWILEPGETALTRSIVVYCSPGGANVSLLAIHPSGRQLATTSESAAAAQEEGRDSAHVLAFPQGQLLGTPLKNLTDSPTDALAYTPDGRYLLAGQSARKVSPLYIIDAQTSKLLEVIQTPDRILDLAVDPHSQLFAAATGDGVTVWKFVRP